MPKYRVMYLYEVIAPTEADALVKVTAKQQHPLRQMPDVDPVEIAVLKISDATSMERNNHGKKED